MELRWGHICADAQFNGLATSLTGLVFGVRAGGPAPFPLTLALRIYASTGDGRDNHLLTVTLTDAQNQRVSKPVELPLEFSQIAPGYPMPAGAKLLLTEWPLLNEGSYSFDCAVDGAPLGHLPLMVYSDSSEGRLPAVKDAPLRLAWAHYVLGFEPIPGPKPDDPVSLVLRDIMEFVPSANLRGE